MDNCDDSGEAAEAMRIARDAAQETDARCEAIRVLSGIISGDDTDGKEVSEEIRTCAAVVKDQPVALQDAAMQSLDQTIRKRAKMAVKQNRSIMAKDFVSISTGLIFERIVAGKYDPQSGGSFPGWCFKVLRNEWLSQIRKSKKDATGHVEIPNPTDKTTIDKKGSVEDGQPTHDQSIDLRAFRDGHFEPEDLEKLRNWKPQDRFLVLSLSDLWTKVPGDDWQRLLRQLSIPMPFPPKDFRELPTDLERFQVVATALQATKPTANVGNVKRQWYRLLQTLKELTCIQRMK